MALTTRHRTRSDAPEREILVYTESDPGSIAHELRPLLTALLGHELPVRVELWDGSAIGPEQATGVLRVRSVDALRRLRGG